MGQELAASEHWRRIEAIFAEAADLSVAERRALLAARTDDPELRDTLERLLAAHDRARGFLGQLDSSRAAALLNEAGSEAGTGELVGRYRVIRRLGRGGMGVVLLAHDPRLDRPVALKLLPPYLNANDAAHRRLTYEAKIACALDDPHIATIHEIGETRDGRLFIAMAYYEGETLRQRIDHGPLPIADALDLATQIAEGLATAHTHGIIHRDIKPANVIVTPGDVAKIVDFGIAKMAGDTLTQTGSTRGTVAYMSPEQTRGEDVDPRTDLWSLGVVLYEMLTGVRPFRGDAEAAVVSGIRNDEPPSLEKRRPDVPPALARVVRRCLARDPDERPASAAALVADLRAVARGRARGRGRGPAEHELRRRSWHHRRSLPLHIGVACAAVALLFVMVRFIPDWRSYSASRAGAETLTADVSSSLTRIAVLPLADFSADAEDAYFADGLTEELISRLSRLRNLRVIARASVMPYENTDKSITAIADELQVSTILGGSVRKSDDQLRIAVQLIDAKSQEQLWSEEYDAELANVLAVQSEIAERVAEALSIQLQRDERRRLTARATGSAEAYRLYLKGRYFWNKRDAESFQKAITQFRMSLDHDPLYAPAWAGLADTYEMLSEGVSPLEQRLPLARAAAERALALDPELAEAHTALATVLTWSGDWEEAGEHYRRAIELNPSYALAHQRHSALLAGAGRLEEGVRAARQAQALDPLSLYARASLGYNLYLARRYEEARTQLLATRELNPKFGLTHLNLVLLNLRTRRYDRALSAARTLHSLWGDHPTVLGLLGHAYAVMGHREEARKVLRKLVTVANGAPVSSFHRGVIQLGLGEHARSIELLERAVEERSTGLIIYLGVDPLFDPLRSDPRFQAVLRKAGLAG